jgi:phosphohistidine swiveling domain-containing protein
MTAATLTFNPADAWHVPYAATPYDVWTRTNVGEVFPEVITPLTFSIFTALGEAVFTGQPERMGLIPQELFKDERPPAVFRVINGRMFYNTGLVHYLFTDRFGFPSWLWMLSLGGPQDTSGRYLEKKPLRLRRLLRNLPRLLKDSRRQQRVVRSFYRDQARLRAQAAVYRRENLAHATETALLARLAAITQHAEAPVAQLFDGSAAALNAYGILAGLCERWCGGRALANDLVTGLDTIITARATVDLWRIARLAAETPAARSILAAAPPAEVRQRLREEPAAAAVSAALEQFFADFGHRGVDEFELSVPRWGEDPEFVVSTLRAYLSAPPEADPQLHRARQRRRARAAEREARRRMQSSVLHRILPYRQLVFRPVLRTARRTLPLRENPKHHFLLYATELRRTILELARRLTAKGVLAQEEDVFFLTREELAVAAESVERGTPAPALPAIISARRALYERFRAWTPPEAIPAHEVATLERAVQQGELPAGAPPVALAVPAVKGELHGIAASSGVVTARARVALSPEEGAAIEPGEVLVAPFTDPGWTPLFTVAGAVVMDLGGLLSHGAIVAREYGIPAVVNTRSATAMLRTGQLITVNGTTGVVTWESTEGLGGG